MARVLVVDDEKLIVKGIRFSLEQDGFEVDCAYDGEEAIELAKKTEYDIVLLDVMLPKHDGFEVCQAIREFSDMPVIMLTARGDDGDKVRGLDMGADDYLPKPFNPRELLSRIRAVMRRTRPVEEENLGDLRLDDGAMKAWKGTVEISLSGQEYRVLRALLSTPGKVVSRDELSRSVFGRDAVPMERGLDMQISRVRRKLGPYEDGSERIRSIRGAGYMYVIHKEERS